MKPSHTTQVNDHKGSIAAALFLANLLFVGIGYAMLWGFYFTSYKSASQVSKNHIKQALAAASLSTLIVLILNFLVVTTTGYASATALIVAEFYLMMVVPLFMLMGILAFIKTIQNRDYVYPVIGRLLGVDRQAD